MDAPESSATDLESTPAIRQAKSRVGAVLRGKWKLDALVGIGGMGAVYAATHRNGRRCAIKVLLPLHGADRRTVQRFLKEGYVANELMHRGAVEIYDDDYTEDGLPFLVMELLEGSPLSAKLREGSERLDVAEVVRIGGEVLDVLAVAHERGIIHRDVKPDNVFLLEDGRVKLLDFGIARLRSVTAAGGTTASGALLGTPAFMAPEQARGRIEEVDARSDVFGVGATLYAALAGREVREAATMNELLLLAMTEPARPLREVAPDVPEVVSQVVDRALSFDQAERWPSARAMRDALLGLASGAASTEPRIAVSSPGTRADDPRIAAHATVAAAAPARSTPPPGSSPAEAPSVPARVGRSGIGAIALAVAVTIGVAAATVVGLRAGAGRSPNAEDVVPGSSVATSQSAVPSANAGTSAATNAPPTGSTAGIGTATSSNPAARATASAKRSAPAPASSTAPTATATATPTATATAKDPLDRRL